MIERWVYIPSTIRLVRGKDEEDIRQKVWEQVKRIYNRSELRIFQNDDLIPDSKWVERDKKQEVIRWEKRTIPSATGP